MKQHEIWRLGDDLIVPTEDGQWTIAYPAAAQDVAEVRRINKRYGANLACCGRRTWSCGNAGGTSVSGNCHRHEMSPAPRQARSAPRHAS